MQNKERRMSDYIDNLFYVLYSTFGVQRSVFLVHVA